MSASLPDLLHAEIRQAGPLPFDSFMEKSLYHPDLGFYASGQIRTGKRGDFLTPVSPGPVLGELLARQADQLHEAMGRPHLLHLIEQGADAGWLARDLLRAIQKNHPDLAPRTRLHLLEPHAKLQHQQRQTLREAGFEKTTQWHPSWEVFPKTSSPAFFYSCELVDSFPVKILQFQNGAWQEKSVAANEARFVWQNREAHAETQAQIRRWHPPESEGYLLELRPGTPAWVQNWTEKIPAGMTLTLDYGFPADQLYSPLRSAGTVVAIRNHQRVPDFLTDPGQLDLTAHVNFTELAELGTLHGWKNYGLTDFARGLTALASPFLRDGKLSESWIRNFRYLTHPSFFGHSHKILIQGKSLPDGFIPILGRQL